MSWAEARNPHMYRPILIALLMRFLQQLMGITPILVYLQPIFESTAVLLVRARPRTSRHLGGRPLPSTCPAARVRGACALWSPPGSPSWFCAMSLFSE